MATKRSLLYRLVRDKTAVTPAISTTIITCAIVVMLLVTIPFANNYLNARIAENEFSAMKQFMQTIGLQVDDVAWTIGRTQTIHFASKFGQINFQASALTYSVSVNNNPIANFSTGILWFNMPISSYSIGNNYYERILPPSDDSFLQIGTSALVSRVYVIEKLPMNDGSYIRIVVTPCIRMMNFTISTGGGQLENHTKFYMPRLLQGTQGALQSVTLVTNRVLVQTSDNVTDITLTAILNASLGFDNSFFRFQPLSQKVIVQTGSKMEFYTGEVTVSLGAYS